jgi:hypothetical protein
MQPDFSVPYLQTSDTGFHSVPHESSSHLHTTFNISFNINLTVMSRSPNWYFFNVSDEMFVSSSLMRVTCHTHHLILLDLISIIIFGVAEMTSSASLRIWNSSSNDNTMQFMKLLAESVVAGIAQSVYRWVTGWIPEESVLISGRSTANRHT